MKVLTDKRLNGLLDFLGIDLLGIKEANDWLMENGMEPKEIQIPVVRILGLDLVFKEDCLQANVTAYPIDKMFYSVGIKPRVQAGLPDEQRFAGYNEKITLGVIRDFLRAQVDMQPKCDCHKHEKQVCDICQGVTGNEKDAE